MKVKITEEQLRLIKEDDEYSKVIELLSSEDKQNKELALFLMKGQDLDLSQIAANILTKNGISDYKDVDAALNTFRRSKRIDLPFSRISWNVSIDRKQGMSILNIVIFSLYGKNYKNSIVVGGVDPNFDYKQSEEEYEDFTKEIYDVLHEKIVEALREEIDMVTKETEY